MPPREAQEQDPSTKALSSPAIQSWTCSSTPPLRVQAHWQKRGARGGTGTGKGWLEASGSIRMGPFPSIQLCICPPSPLSQLDILRDWMRPIPIHWDALQAPPNHHPDLTTPSRTYPQDSWHSPTTEIIWRGSVNCPPCYTAATHPNQKLGVVEHTSSRDAADSEASLEEDR